MDNRSPLQNIFGIIGGLPQGHNKPVKHALYNAVALLLLFLCCAAVWALYMILEPFIKPLIWALLVGSVLHPLKRSLRDKFQIWFESLEVSHTPVVLGVLLLPINIINDLSDLIGDQLVKRMKFIVGVCVTIPLVLLIYNYTPGIVASLLWHGFSFAVGFLTFFLDNTTLPMILLILIGYFTVTYLAWKPENNKTFHYASIGVWLFLSCYLANHCGTAFQLPVFLLLQIVIFGGFASEVYDIHNEINATEGDNAKSFTLMETLSLVFDNKSLCCNTDEDDEEEDEEVPQANIDDNIIKNDDVTTPMPPTLKSSDNTINNKAKEPWSLELFSDGNKSSANLKNDKQTDSELSNASLLITNQGTVHVIKPPSSQPTTDHSLSEILRSDHISSSTRKKQLKRSLSQPHFYNPQQRPLKYNILSNYYTRRINSAKNSHQSIDATETGNYESRFYLCSILWACIIMLFWKNIILLPLLLLPILFYSIKHIGKYFGLWNLLYQHFNRLASVVAKWCNERLDALVPVPIRGLFRIVYKANVCLKGSVKNSIDTVSSCVVIFILIIFVTCASIFIVFQIYAEAIMMVQMTSNVINQTVVHNPELRQLLPPAWDDTVDSILDNAYQYGREGISKAVKSMMTNVDLKKSEKLERQVLELWDRLYQTWMMNSSLDNDHGPKVTHDAVRTSWHEFLSDIQKSPEMFNLSGMMDFAKQNIGTLMSLVESIWAIVKGNIGMVLGSFSAFLSIILGGGTAVLNFILNVIVFLTTLFYLLSSSGDYYKPVEIMTSFSSSSRRFGHALEGAINGVFTASFKMAAFYGMWTWFIHNLFGAKIVYLPSAFATILGAVPFLGTYWACFPAVLDLWLAQDRGIEAILFALCQFLPMSVVDTTIYKEIKGGGHPYLTGLAIAGGIFCLGVEGAIIGPLLLCGLFVAMDLSSNLFKESPSEENLNLRLHLQDR